MAMRLDHGTDELEEVHGINVTPFIDVMLVLLIIFMVAAPLATVDIAVDLPSSNAEQQQKPDQADLSDAQAGSVACHRRQPGRARRASAGALDSATGGNKDDRIFLRADRGVPYGEVMAVMNELRGRALSEGGAGRAGDTARRMSMSTFAWHDDRSPRELPALGDRRRRSYSAFMPARWCTFSLSTNRTLSAPPRTW